MAHTSKNMNKNRGLIKRFRDMADIADASYAMLHYVDENEKIDYRLDELKSNNPNENVKPPARWIYADNIKLGYKKDNGIPTAYALAIEARFSPTLS